MITAPAVCTLHIPCNSHLCATSTSLRLFFHPGTYHANQVLPSALSAVSTAFGPTMSSCALKCSPSYVSSPTSPLLYTLMLSFVKQLQLRSQIHAVPRYKIRLGSRPTLAMGPAFLLHRLRHRLSMQPTWTTTLEQWFIPPNIVEARTLLLPGLEPARPV